MEKRLTGNLLSAYLSPDWLPAARMLLLSMYVAGLVGLNLPALQPLFRLLVPFHLLTNAALLLAFQSARNRPFVIFGLIAFFTGFLIEWLGVSTGAIFGNYWYGNTLGIKIGGIPVVIGVNWWVLTFVTGVMCENLKTHYLLKALFAALLMTGLDFLIEPVAIRQDFWHWQHEVIPLQNYAAWLVVAFALQIVFQKLGFEKKNPLALLVYVLQVAFFLIQRLF